MNNSMKLFTLPRLEGTSGVESSELSIYKRGTALPRLWSWRDVTTNTAGAVYRDGEIQLLFMLSLLWCPICVLCWLNPTGTLTAMMSPKVTSEIVQQGAEERTSANGFVRKESCNWHFYTTPVLILSNLN